MKNLEIFELHPLFEEVQVRQIYLDGKTFVDCTPRFPLQDVQERYLLQKELADFDLKAFVDEHFEQPEKYDNGYKTDASRPIEEHIHNLWDVLTRQTVSQGGTLLPLPAKFVVPGGRFREIYYWDSYFTMLGLQASGRVDLIESMVQNFASLISNYGHIPNGNRSYYLSRSQAPFFSYMVRLLAEEKGNTILTQYLPMLEKEYQYWMHGERMLNSSNRQAEHTVLMPDGTVLNRYWDSLDLPRPEGYAEDIEIKEGIQADTPGLFRHIRAACESGWDFSGRWFTDCHNIATINTTNIVPIDLNCLLLHLEETIADACEVIGNVAKAKNFHQKVTIRKAAINKYLWQQDLNLYMDYNHANSQPTQAISMAMAFPLFVKIANNRQATSVCAFIKNNLLKSGGLLTTPNNTGQQWDAPNGWAPLQWIGYKSSLNYNFYGLADTIKHNWLANVERVYKATGKLMEKYNVTDTAENAGGGEYPNQDGFGWTNGVYLKMRRM